MIDEKRLTEIKNLPKDVNCFTCLDNDELSDLISLARLGLWAKEHGIPTINNTAQQWAAGYTAQEAVYNYHFNLERCNKAIAALPKELTDG